jgi:hypothetical protein
VPNGHEAHIFLRKMCATYRFRYGEWPTRLEVSPNALWSLARELHHENFGRVAKRLEIRLIEERASSPYRMMVSGDPGELDMRDASPSPIIKILDEGRAWEGYLDEARGWLDVEEGKRREE